MDTLLQFNETLTIQGDIIIQKFTLTENILDSIGEFTYETYVKVLDIDSKLSSIVGGISDLVNDSADIKRHTQYLEKNSEPIVDAFKTIPIPVTK